MESDFQKVLILYYLQGIHGENVDESEIEFIGMGHNIAYYTYNKKTYVIVDSEQGPIAHEATEEQSEYAESLVDL